MPSHTRSGRRSLVKALAAIVVESIGSTQVTIGGSLRNLTRRMLSPPLHLPECVLARLLRGFEAMPKPVYANRGQLATAKALVASRVPDPGLAIGIGAQR